jgi:hypothetical protein
VTAFRYTYVVHHTRHDIVCLLCLQPFLSQPPQAVVGGKCGSPTTIAVINSQVWCTVDGFWLRDADIGELRESRGKIASLVLMESGVSRELAKAEAEWCQAKEALEVVADDIREREAVTPHVQEVETPYYAVFELT